MIIYQTFKLLTFLATFAGLWVGFEHFPTKLAIAGYFWCGAALFLLTLPVLMAVGVVVFCVFYGDWINRIAEEENGTE